MILLNSRHIRSKIWNWYLSYFDFFSVIALFTNWYIKSKKFFILQYFSNTYCLSSTNHYKINANQSAPDNRISVNTMEQNKLHHFDSQNHYTIPGQWSHFIPLAENPGVFRRYKMGTLTRDRLTSSNFVYRCIFFSRFCIHLIHYNSTVIKVPFRVFLLSFISLEVHYFPSPSISEQF